MIDNLPTFDKILIVASIIVMIGAIIYEKRKARNIYHNKK